jgi:hypothetical protein
MHVLIEKFYTPPKIPKIENEGGDVTMDFGDVKVEHEKNILEFTKTLVKRIIMKTQKL